MSEKFLNMTFLEYLDLFKLIQDDDKVCNITSMAGGKYYIPKHHFELFYKKYENHIKTKPKQILYLQEKIPKYGTKLFIDIDCKTEEESSNLIKKFECTIIDVMNIESVYLLIQKNSIYSTKKHVFAQYMKKSIIINPYLLEYITFLVGSDATKGLRLPGSCKKEGPEKGIYLLNKKDTIANYSLLYHKNIYEPSYKLKLFGGWRNWHENIKHPNSNICNKKHENLLLSSQEEINKQIDWLLEKILETNSQALENYGSWWNIVQACKNLNYDCGRLDEYCKKIEKYEDDTGVLKEYEKDYQTNKTLGTLIYYIDDKLKKEFFRLFIPIQKGGSVISNDIKILIEEGTDYALSKIFYIMKKDDVKVLDTKGGNESIIMWNSKKYLWEYVSLSFISNQITEVCKNISEILLKEIKEKLNVLEDGTKDFVYLSRFKKSIEITYKRCQSWKCATSAAKYFLQIEEAKDDYFRSIIDSDIYSLPLKGGLVINLKNGESRLRSKDDYFSNELNISLGDPHNKNVIDYFMGLANNDEEIYSYLQEICGYTLSGSQYEKCIFLIYGEKDSGKSEFIRMLSRILDSYFFTTNNLLIKGKKVNINEPEPELASIQGKRMISKVETDKFQKLDEVLLKKISGGDEITARFLGSNPFSFKPICKIFIATNYQPNFDFTDAALVDRLRYIHFKNKFEKSTKNIEFVDNIYKNHINDIFAWMIEGAKKYFSINKFNIPEECIKQQKEEISQQNDFELWIKDNIVILPNSNEKIKGSIVYQRYKDDMIENGLPVDNIKIFYLKCKSMNIHTKIKDGYKSFTGIELIQKDIY